MHLFVAELAVDMLSILTSYNITVKELKQLMSMLKGENGKWVSLVSFRGLPSQPRCLFDAAGVG